MTDVSSTGSSTKNDSSTVAMDVFDAARWFNDLWNSTAHAAARDQIEWQCNTWGSGNGCGGWESIALFCVVAEVFELSTHTNYEARDELVVRIPLEKVDEVIELIKRIGEDPQMWAWLDDEEYEDAPELRLAKASELLGRSIDFLKANDFLMEQLRLP